MLRAAVPRSQEKKGWHGESVSGQAQNFRYPYSRADALGCNGKVFLYQYKIELFVLLRVFNANGSR
jgi:hypothetical protein